MKRHAFVALLVAALIASSTRVVGAEPKPVWMAVGAAELLAALAPLIEHRRQEGFRVLTSSDSVDKARAELAGSAPAYLLVLGDDSTQDNQQTWNVPAPRRTLYRWRDEQAREFAADALWGDRTGDLIPDFPVGRIPARTARDVARAVAKILAFERQEPTVSLLRMPIWTGSPEYGPAFDALATGLLLSSVDSGAPAWVEPWILAGDPRHPLCGWPLDQPQAFAAESKRGGLVSVLMGHSNETHFYSMAAGRTRITFSAADARAAWSEGTPTAPLIMFTCLAGDFAGPRESLAESLFALPGGPVATVAATTESHPLTNYFSGAALLAEASGRQERLGDFWLKAQLDARKARSVLMESMLKDVEGKLEEAIDVEQLRRDQLLMYAILGDPATRLSLPATLRLTTKRAGKGWRWTVERPADWPAASVGTLRVEHRPTATTLAPLAAPITEAKPAREAAERANAGFRFRQTGELPADSAWEGTLEEPGVLRVTTVVNGRLHVGAVKLAR